MRIDAEEDPARLARGVLPLTPPAESMLGGLVRYLASANPKGFQPMNVNWALVPELPVEINEKTGKPRKLGKREKRPVMFQRGLNAFTLWALDKAGLNVTPQPIPEPAGA